MNLIKCRFLKDGQPTGKPYTYDSPVAVKPGDIIQINSSATGVVVEVDVSEEEVVEFRDKIKSIIGLAEKTTNLEKKDEAKKFQHSLLGFDAINKLKEVATNE